MKKYLFIALAAMGFAACAEKDEMGNKPINNGEVEKSYVAITLASNEATRAEDELDKVFGDGTDEESAVGSAYVFFFRDGVAFPVSYSDSDKTTTEGGTCNYLSLNNLNMKPEADDTNSVSDYSDEILVIENYRGEYPNQIVAVLNWVPTAPSYSIADLQTQLLNIQNSDEKFVMCNSVFADEATPKQTIIAAPITEANIGTKEDADNKRLVPVQIYVERLAAKVVFQHDGVYATGETVVDRTNGANEEIAVSAKVLGYELFDAYYDSWLVKKIDPEWSNTVLGFIWNDSPNYRSYWADSETGRTVFEFPATNSFEWNTNPGEQYCGENTRGVVGGVNDRTKVVVKAQLVNAADGVTPVEVVNWLGQTYVNEDYLKIVVANTLNEKYFSSTDEKTYVGLMPEDLRCVERNSNAEKAYYVDFQLSTNANNFGIYKTWYMKSADGTYTKIASIDAMNAELLEVHPALVYNDGMTYYYTDIRHLANNTDKVGAYGVVRNHVYVVNIDGITSFGTPIYNPTQDFVEVETPEEIYTYVSAKINILSWRMVERDYVLE